MLKVVLVIIVILFMIGVGWSYTSNASTLSLWKQGIHIAGMIIGLFVLMWLTKPPAPVR